MLDAIYIKSKFTALFNLMISRPHKYKFKCFGVFGRWYIVFNRSIQIIIIPMYWTL